jgi:hypothetical protein
LPFILTSCRWKSAFKELPDSLLHALLTAGTFGWPWPE